MRRCGFSDQHEFEENTAGYRAFLTQHTKQSMQEFDDEEIHAIGSVEAFADAIKLHMQTNQKAHVVSLWMVHSTKPVQGMLQTHVYRQRHLCKIKFLN